MFTTPDHQYRAAAVIVSHDHILLCHTAIQSYWYLPGANMRLHEKAVSALERELQRQLCLQPQVGRLIWAVNGYFQTENALEHEVGLYHLVHFERNAGIYQLDNPFFGCEEKNPDNRLIFQWFPRHADILERLPLQPKFLARAVEKLPLSPEYIVYRDSAVFAV